MSRSERGLLAYDACTTDELETFCKDRAIRTEGQKARSGLINLLEQADESLIFVLFSDVPPELRNRIYSYNLDASCPTNRPHPPPITQVCRQLRQESLELYFLTCTVDITFNSADLGYRLFA